MRTLDEFRTFYENELQDAIAKSRQEIERFDASEEAAYSVVDAVQMGGLFAVPAFLCRIPFVYEEVGLAHALADAGEIALWVGGIVALLAWIKGVEAGKRMLESAHVQETVKKNVASKIVSFFGEDFSLDPADQIDKETINESLTFPRAAKEAYGEDFVSGTVGDTAVEFSEVILSRSPFAEVKQVGVLTTEEKKEQVEKMKRYKMSKMAAADNAHFFRGLYFVADFPKAFRGHTVVRPTDGDLDPEDRLTTADGPALGRLEQVHLEDPELESVYNVYGTDQQQARYILSTSLMERIKNFRGRTGKSVYLSFYESNMHVAVPYSRDLLELRELRSKEELLGDTEIGTIVDRERAFDYFKDLTFILEIVEEFDLNTRIWLKATV